MLLCSVGISPTTLRDKGLSSIEIEEEDGCMIS